MWSDFKFKSMSCMMYPMSWFIIPFQHAFQNQAPTISLLNKKYNYGKRAKSRLLEYTQCSGSLGGLTLMERQSDRTFIFWLKYSWVLINGILKIFAMLGFLEFAIDFFAYVLKLEKIAIFKRKFYYIKFAQNEKAH